MDGEQKEWEKKRESGGELQGATRPRTEQKTTTGEGQKSVFPVFLDGEAPLPGQVVVFVVVCKLGLDYVGAAGQHPLGGLLDGRQVLVGLIGPGAVAPDHVL